MALLADLDEYGVKGGPESHLALEPIVWHQDARCAEPDADPEWFYVERGQSPSRALKVCARCPVRAECLSYALNDGDARA